MNQTAKKIWNWGTTLLVAIVVVLALLLAGARLVGLQVFTVLSGSMEPAYHVGSLIYVRRVDPGELEAGDVITFLLNEDVVVTHRIVEILPDEQDPQTLRFRTRGDANDVADGALVHQNNIIGTPVFMIPFLGRVANFVQHRPGSYLAGAFCALLLLATFLPDLLSGDKKEGAAQKAESDGGSPADAGPDGGHAENAAARASPEKNAAVQEGGAEPDSF